jgi:hypothetical protein
MQYTNPHKRNRNIKRTTMPSTSHHRIGGDIDVATILTSHSQYAAHARKGGKHLPRASCLPSR